MQSQTPPSEPLDENIERIVIQGLIDQLIQEMNDAKAATIATTNKLKDVQRRLKAIEQNAKRARRMEDKTDEKILAKENESMREEIEGYKLRLESGGHSLDLCNASPKPVLARPDPFVASGNAHEEYKRRRLHYHNQLNNWSLHEIKRLKDLCNKHNV